MQSTQSHSVNAGAVIASVGNHRLPRFTRWGAIGIALLIAAGFAPSTVAAPQGGSVVAGDASIHQDGKQTTIDQRTGRIIIDWRKFDLKADEIARFNQPGSDSIALNRVRGGDPSILLGQLSANGHVWLINPQGVLFGPGAKVNVGGLVAATTDIRNEDFLADRFEFSLPSPVPTAAVVNQGTISFGERGLAALVAPEVRNEGVIVGRLGQVALAGAAGFALDLQADGLIRFAATTEAVEGLRREGALVSNTGSIGIDGGQVLITAVAAEGVVDQAIYAGGIIEARSFAVHDGQIILDGGSHGTVTVAGALSTIGTDPDARGGSIDILGDQLMLASGSRLDASGAAGGGVIHVGGDLRGEGTRRQASQTIMTPGATIVADATRRGDGGQVVLWANDRLIFAGSVTAKGGPDGGNGGLVETSVKAGPLEATGRVDVRAPQGQPGTWLIDPLHVVIADDGTTLPPILADDPPADGQARISPAAIAAAGGDVVIQAQRTIIIVDALNTPNNLILRAGVGIEIRQPIISSGEIRIDTRDIRTSGQGLITAGRLVIDSIGLQPGFPAGPAFTSFSASLATDVDALVIGRDALADPFFRNVAITNLGDLSLEGVTAQGTVTIRTQGRIVVNSAISAAGTGATIVLAADSFENRIGAGALDPGSGRFIVYATSPDVTVRGGLAGAELFGRTIASSPPEAIPGTGNTFVYAVSAPPASSQLQIATRGIGPVAESTVDVVDLPDDVLTAPLPSAADSDDLLFSNDGNRELWN